MTLRYETVGEMITTNQQQKAEQSIRQQVAANMQRDREVRMYGLTEADLRESVERSITFKTAGPAMIVASWMSDAQEEIAMGADESARLTLNRAKWVLFEYLDTRA